MKTTILVTMLLLAAHNAHSDTITAYCACVKCCGKNAKGITAMGTRPVEGRTVAAARSIPLGTRIHIEGIGWRIVEDRTARRYDGRVDVYFKSHNDALQFGKLKLQITIQRTNKETKHEAKLHQNRSSKTARRL